MILKYKHLLSLSLLMIVFIACYYHTFIWLNYKYLYVDSYYSHGYLIPIISAYIIYTIRDQLKLIELSSERSGIIVIIFALIIHILAFMSDVNFISGFSIFLYIFGCLLFLTGREFTKRLAFPLLFLLFMFPIPGTFIDVIGLPTKSFATDVGLMIIGLIDIPFFREGFRITLSNTTMIVGTPCSGMKSLISFSAISALALYFVNLGLKKNIIVLAGVYPLAVILNGFRIAILIYIADTYGIDKASPESLLHDLSGIIVFVGGLFIIFFSIRFFERKKFKTKKE